MDARAKTDHILRDVSGEWEGERKIRLRREVEEALREVERRGAKVEHAARELVRLKILQKTDLQAYEREKLMGTVDRAWNQLEHALRTT